MTPLPSDPHVGIVVEGPGDGVSLPILLRRWLQSQDDFRDLVGQPISCNGRDKALVPSGIEGKVAAAAARPGCVGVLVVLDGEGDPVCALGPQLYARAIGASGGKPVEIVLADPKYEAWIVASAEDLNLDGLTFNPTSDPVTLLKEALKPTKYAKPIWQPRLTDRIDLGRAAARSQSFSRLLSSFADLVGLVPLAPGAVTSN